MSDDGFRPRRPDYVLRVKVKNKGERGATAVFGKGWANEDGHVSIQLNPEVVLAWNDNLYITLFPKEGTEE